MPLDRLPARALVGVALFAGLAFQLLLGTSYVAAFLDPVGESTGVPVAVVNLDEGGRGAEFVERIRAADTPVAWHEATLAEATGGLREKRFVAALVLPVNLTEALGSAATPEPRAALVDVLLAPGVSRTGSLVAERVLALVTERLEQEAQATALAAASPLGGDAGVVTVAQARWIADPVRVQTSEVDPLAPSAAMGLGPVYLAMGAWMGGYVGAIALERFRERTRLRVVPRSLVLAVAAGVQGSVAAVFAAGAGLAVPDALVLGAVLAVGTWMAYALVAFLTDVAGIAGALPAFAVLALGLPASGGIYPVEMLPSFYRALHPYDPLAWLVEALRTALYTPAAGDLAGHVLRLAGVASVATVASLVLVGWRARRDGA